MTTERPRANPGPSTGQTAGGRAFERIVRDISDSIQRGDLRPGDRLSSERELMSRYVVGRSSVREALRVLESLHLVRSDEGRKAPVVLAASGDHTRQSLSSLTTSMTLVDLVQFRMIVDSSANLIAARLRSPAHLITLERNLARMRESMTHGYRAFSLADLEFHEIIAEAAGNPAIEICGDIVRESILELIGDAVRAAEDRGALMLRSIRVHEEVLDALSAHDGTRASRLAREALYTYYARRVSDEQRQTLADLVHEVGGVVQD